MKKRVIIGLLLVLLAVIVLYLRRAPEQGDEGVLRISGNIELTEVQVSFKVPGRLEARLVDEGAVVKRGDVIARLEDVELRDAAQTAQAEADAAAASVAELEAGSRREEIAQGEALLARAEAEATRVAADYQRQQNLYAKEVIPKRDLEASRAANEQARATVRERQQALQLLKKGARSERIDEARARQRGALARLSTAKERESYATLLAPISGVVLSKSVEPGEQVAPGTPVVTIGDMEQCWLKGYIPETELGRVKLGQRARVTTDSHPDRFFEGKVSFISSEAEFTPKSVQTEKERVKLVYRIKISLSNAGMELKPGMPADAVIEVGTKQTQRQ